jgi:hypothetical protein
MTTTTSDHKNYYMADAEADVDLDLNIAGMSGPPSQRPVAARYARSTAKVFGPTITVQIVIHYCPKCNAGTPKQVTKGLEHLGWYCGRHASYYQDLQAVDQILIALRADPVASHSADSLLEAVFQLFIDGLFTLEKERQ